MSSPSAYWLQSVESENTALSHPPFYHPLLLTPCPPTRKSGNAWTMDLLSNQISRALCWWRTCLRKIRRFSTTSASSYISQLKYAALISPANYTCLTEFLKPNAVESFLHPPGDFFSWVSKSCSALECIHHVGFKQHWNSVDCVLMIAWNVADCVQLFSMLWVGPAVLHFVWAVNTCHIRWWLFVW